MTIHPYLPATLSPAVFGFLRDESGQDLIEYALVAALLALGTIATLRNVSTKLVSLFTSIASGVTSAA